MIDKSKDNPNSVHLSNQYLNHPQTEFDAILNSIPDVIVRFNLSGKVVWWNQNLEDVMSLSRDVLLAYFLPDLFQSYNNKSISFLIDETAKNGGAEIDALLSTSAGNKRYHLKSTLIEGASEKEILIVGRDIDERELMLDELINNKAQLQNLIDALPYLVFLMTVDDKYLVANEMFCKFLGFPKDEVIGFKNKDIFNDDSEIVEYLVRDNDKILSEKCSVHYESAIELDKISISLSINKFPLFNHENKIYAICGVVEDVTSQHQLQRQLQQSQKMEAVGQLSGGIAHDFNNVLASIMGYTGLTQKRIAQYSDETIDGYLSQITRAGERARDLVQQLLAFSRGDVGGLQILSPEPLAEESIKMLSSLIPSSINLILKINSNVLTSNIEVDPVQFNQSIMNLVINARDSFVDGLGEITVELDCLDVANDVCDSCHTSFSGKYICLSVSDCGEGIGNDIRSRVFDPFFTTKGVGKGSGMGLSMVHGIVHGSGGHIVISTNSSSNNGTTIKMYFPESSRSVIQSNAVEEENADYLSESLLLNNFNKTILIIDDESLITHYLDDLLTGVGYNVITFNNPITGLKYFKDNSDVIDLVITDQTMPNLTGIEFVRNIFNDGHELPIILCSGYRDFANDSANQNIGIDVFMDKPFNEELLLKHVDKLLKYYIS